MANYKIFTENTADLPDDYIKENDITVLNLSYTLENVTYGGSGIDLEPEEFYNKVRSGSMPITSQVNVGQYLDAFTKVFEESDDDILVISFSSGLSGSYNSSMMAIEEIKEQYPDRKVLSVDSLCASLGQGMLVYKVVEKKKQGASIDEAYAYAEEIKANMRHEFTVDDLNHLHRGGRVSKSAAVLGSLINIKPILKVDAEGHLTVQEKVKGRKKSLLTLVELMEKNIGSKRDENDIFMVSHADALEDAEFVAKKVKERFGIEKCIINYIGPTIGTHAGPGTVALFYVGEAR